jgi:hypothetical protein
MPVTIFDETARPGGLFLVKKELTIFPMTLEEGSAILEKESMQLIPEKESQG